MVGYAVGAGIQQWLPTTQATSLAFNPSPKHQIQWPARPLKLCIDLLCLSITTTTLLSC